MLWKPSEAAVLFEAGQLLSDSHLAPGCSEAGGGGDAGFVALGESEG